MANIDKLARAENELAVANKQLAEMQNRVKTIQQKVLKLRSEKILELVKNAGMGPDEIKELLSAYQEGRMLQRFENAAGNPAGDIESAGYNDQEVKTENETI